MRVEREGAEVDGMAVAAAARARGSSGRGWGGRSFSPPYRNPLYTPRINLGLFRAMYMEGTLLKHLYGLLCIGASV